MIDRIIYPKQLNGIVTAPPSKSQSHRAIISAGLSSTDCLIDNVLLSEDIKATASALQALGVKITFSPNQMCIENGLGGGKANTSAIIDCRESGSTLRFMLPIASALGVSGQFIGTGKLPNRPFAPLAEQMQNKGIAFSRVDSMPFEISGMLQAGRYTLPGDISSQFITGLLFALPLLKNDSELIITSTLESSGYVDMTIATLKQAGIVVRTISKGYFIAGNQHYNVPTKMMLEGDYSNAAFWLAAGVLSQGAGITCSGLLADSKQGDREIVSLIKQMGGDITTTENAVTARPSILHGIDIDCSQVPDLVPILSVLACGCNGTTRLYNAQRVRLKESDRLSAMTNCLGKIGANITQTEDSLIIEGKSVLTGGCVDGYDDHRIVMAMAISSLLCSQSLTINGSQAVSKSEPDFFEKFCSLGGECHVVNVGK